MNTNLLKLALLGLIPAALFAAEPKRLLVVGGASGFRHPSIPNGEKMLGQLAARSNGAYTVTFLGDSPGYPYSRVSTPSTGGGGGRGRGANPFPGQATGASPEQQAAITALGAPVVPYSDLVTIARSALTAATFAAPSPAKAADIESKAAALGVAEQVLATARADALIQLQASANRLSAEQKLALSGMAPAAARGGAAGAGRGGNAGDEAVLARIYQDHLSVAALQKYDGIFFVSTVGIQPIPDFAGFMKWVEDGHAVMGLHGAMDNGPMPDAYREMFSGGASFAGHPGGGTTPRAIFKVDAVSPITKDWLASGSMVVDEFYQFRNLDRAKIHSLVDMDFEGVRHPLVWIKNHGKGRVFYTAMGHRDDVMMPDTPNMDYDNAKVNSNEVSAAYQKMVDTGIRWALGLIEADATPGNVK